MQTKTSFRKIDTKSGEELLKKAKSIAPRVRKPLRGQLQIAIELRKKGLSYAEISDWLGQNGLPVHATTISRYVREEVA
jgi:hypothetical protein